jgi:hypothetical protein
MSRNPLFVALLATLCAVGAGVLWLGRPALQAARPPLFELAARSEAPTGPPPVETGPPSAGPEPVEVLRAWDARRARAWARGDPRSLRRLYTPDSVAGRRDRAMLRAWATRGLVVRDLRTQLLSVRELARTRSSWTLLVTDRLAGGVVVGAGVRRALPRDEPSTRTVRLRRLGGVWRVASVRPAEEVRP